MSLYFIPGSNPVPKPGGNDRRGMDLLEKYLKSVGKGRLYMAILHGINVPVEAGSEIGEQTRTPSTSTPGSTMQYQGSTTCLSPIKGSCNSV